MSAKLTKPAFEPFEVIKNEDGSKTSTWRHPDGQLEQWTDNERVYGPKAEEPAVEPVDEKAVEVTDEKEEAPKGKKDK